MKQLITQSGKFGPFIKIETLSDRYVCDGGEYQFSVIGSATIEDYVSPAPLPEVPEQVPMTKGRIALLNKGWLTDVLTFINGLQGTEGDKVRIYFEFSPVIHRDNAIVAMVAAAKGWTKKQVDDLFIDAAAL